MIDTVAKKLRVVYIRPSTYDDDGYVVRFWQGVLPSNTMACLRSLTDAVAASGTLGADVEVARFEHYRLVVIAAQGDLAVLPHQVQARQRVRAVADDVAQADDPPAIVGTNVRQHRGQRRKVRVNVGDYREHILFHRVV